MEADVPPNKLHYGRPEPEFPTSSVSILPQYVMKILFHSPVGEFLSSYISELKYLTTTVSNLPHCCKLVSFSRFTLMEV